MLLVLVLFMGACSTEPESIVEDTNKYYKEMGLTERNEFEISLEGRWITAGRTTEDAHYVISEYTWTVEKGKRNKIISISEGVTNSISELSYEIKYDAKNPNQALLIAYTIDEGTASISWDAFPLYIEIEKQNNDVYYEYMRYYYPIEDAKKGPTALKRGNSLGGWDRI